jgi:hypothetical protein
MAAAILESFSAVCARAARIHHAANARKLPDLESGCLHADLHYAPYDLVSGHERIVLRPPFSPHGMDVRVADPAIEDLETHVARSHFAALQDPGFERFGGTIGSVGFGGNHERWVLISGIRILRG